MQEEHKPWAIIRVNAPVQPQAEFDIIPPVTRPICLTEEYAISDFTSVCRMQINLVITAPVREILIMRGAIERLNFIKFEETRIMPYPPNFSKIPARIIEPATGASTWALGSQRWVINKGVLTRKAIIVINHHKEEMDEWGINDQKGSVKIR